MVSVTMAIETETEGHNENIDYFYTSYKNINFLINTI